VDALYSVVDEANALYSVVDEANERERERERERDRGIIQLAGPFSWQGHSVGR
jgi:hypothetical protein